MNRAAMEAMSRGASVLDEMRPGWEFDVNPDILDMGNPGYCVLGQLSNNGSYSSEMRKVQAYLRAERAEVEGPTATYYGFDALSNMSYYYDELTEAWAFEIRKRRSRP